MTEAKIKNHTIAKRAAGEAAANLVKDGMLVGLGTGSTTAFFIDRLAERCRQGLKITAFATSKKSQQQAKEKGIPLLESNKLERVDLTVDGADEIDPQKRMIKGGGGALLYEKIMASSSNEVVIIIDKGKLVKKLGKMPLPVEIVPFGYRSTLLRMKKLGFDVKMRMSDSNELYLTDGGHYIGDIHFLKPLDNPEQVNQQLLNLPGIIETGFFFHLAGRVIIGYEDGHTEELSVKKD